MKIDELRQRLIKCLERMDKNGIWSDADCVAHGLKPLNLWLVWCYCKSLGCESESKEQEHWKKRILIAEGGKI